MGTPRLFPATPPRLPASGPPVAVLFGAFSSLRRDSWRPLAAKLVALATLPSLPSIPRYLTVLVILMTVLK